MALAILCLSATQVIGQNKLEMEESVDAEEVPDKAHLFIKECCAEEKVYWFREKGLDEISYEAKLKRSGQWHSIEFNKEGEIEDIEVLMRYKRIPEPILETIEDSLNSHFNRYKVDRAQKQYKSDKSLLLGFMTDEKHDDSAFRIAYELVVLAKTETGIQAFEYLFAESGEILRRAKILIRETDNLSY